MSGAIFSRHPYAFKACEGTISPLLCAAVFW